MVVGREPDVDAATDWSAVHRRLTARGPSSLDGGELELLADALFWLDRTDESIAVRRLAYQAHCNRGDRDRSALATWRLFYDHHLVGERSVAAGWLQRCRRHLADHLDGGPGGWLAVAESDVARDRGLISEAEAHARRAHQVGRTVDDADLRAMALLAEGRAVIAGGNRLRGLTLLDEAMVAVINDELGTLYTGWVFCGVVSACYDLADLRRAREWSDAALRWCRTLRHGLMYPGLCRVYAAELALLRGDWLEAEAGARRACQELVSHDPRYAGTAFYLVGELRRLADDIPAALRAFDRAQQLGRLPQPGLARLHHADGRATDAVAALRSALQPGPGAPLTRAQILAVLVEVALDASEPVIAGEAADALDALADEIGSAPIVGLAAGARGRVLLADHRPAPALGPLRRAVELFLESGMAHEAARHRLPVALAAGAVGDRSTARFELTAAADELHRLGASADAALARRLVDQLGPAGDDGPARPAAEPAGAVGPAVDGSDPSPLTRRELDVLRLVASGRTNRAIADELALSRHTVARHLSNIFVKLAVRSRAAATAAAYDRGLLSVGSEWI